VSADEAIAQLRLLRLPSEGVSTERFRAVPQDFARLLRSKDHPLSALGRKWCETAGAFDESIHSFAGADGILPMMMIVAVGARDREPVFRFIGDEFFSWVPPGYPGRAIGQKIEQLPDRQFGAWLSRFYRSVAQSGEPRFDQVSARVQMHQSHAPSRLYANRYERLALPWRGACGETLVSALIRRFDAAPASPRALQDA
jgi:hypothetical protein